jgi:hypothetical protein
MEVLKIAFEEFGSGSGQKRRVVLSNDPDNVVKAIIGGAPVLLILSKNVLQCKEVLRGLLLCTTGVEYRVVVPIFPDRLEFAFPDEEDLSALYRASEKSFEVTEVEEERKNGHIGIGRSKSFIDANGDPISPTAAKWCENFSQVVGHSETKSAFEEADDLVHFLLLIFKLIALPLSTHASWTTLKLQLQHIFNRTIVVDAGGPVFDPRQLGTYKANSPHTVARNRRASSSRISLSSNTMTTLRSEALKRLGSSITDGPPQENGHGGGFRQNTLNLRI